MAVLTGATGALRFNGVLVAKVRNWSLNMSKDALEDTCLSQNDRTYVPGLRGATGSCTILYDPLDSTSTPLLNNLFEDKVEPTDVVEFIMSQTAGKRISGSAIVTNVSPSVNVGAVQSADIQFRMSGPVTGGF